MVAYAAVVAPEDGLDILPTHTRGHGVALHERRHKLTASVESASQARRQVREALHAAARTDWVDAAELATSEVVTNASLHAHSSIDLWLGVYEDEICVEVRDFNPTLPVQRDYDLEATTGRGMALVTTLTKSCGVHSLGEHGKVVWFCVDGMHDATDPDDLLTAWDIDDLLEGERTAPDDCEIVLASMPVTLWLAARQHHDAMIRELVLYQGEHDAPTLDIALADAARAAISTAIVAAIDAARADGTSELSLPHDGPGPFPRVPTQLDLTVSVPADASDMFATLQDVLDVGERLAVQGRFLIRPGLPEIVAVRDWACDQAIAQLAGAPPAPWAGTDQERFERDVHDRELPNAPDWDAEVVTNAATGAIAADDANRIVAVSRPLSDLLGWSPDDLVGRRIVTIVPPALREAHVAGFSRHLSTGESHVLGVPLDLPMLRKDGSEVLCRFLIEQAPVDHGRPVYVAWIEPLH